MELEVELRLVEHRTLEPVRRRPVWEEELLVARRKEEQGHRVVGKQTVELQDIHLEEDSRQAEEAQLELREAPVDKHEEEEAPVDSYQEEGDLEEDNYSD
jgi:hypothetical protein